MYSLRKFVIIGAAIAAVPAFPAAIQFTEVTASGAKGGGSKMQVVVDGSHFKATFVENPQGIPPVGTYVVGSGDGQMYLVSPATKAFARFSPADFAPMAQQAVSGMKHAKDQEERMGVTHSLENFKFEKLTDEAGPTLFGLPTRHYRYRLSYQDVMHIKGAPMAMTSGHEEVHEFWSTTALGDVAKVPDFGGSGGGMSTGVESADKTMEARREMATHGMMLKSLVTTKTSQGGMGMVNPFAALAKNPVHTATREIVAFDHIDPPHDVFEVPKDFQETDLMSLFTAAAGGMPNLNALQGPGAKAPPAMPDLNKDN